MGTLHFKVEWVVVAAVAADTIHLIYSGKLSAVKEAASSKNSLVVAVAAAANPEEELPKAQTCATTWKLPWKKQSKAVRRKSATNAPLDANAVVAKGQSQVPEAQPAQPVVAVDNSLQIVALLVSGKFAQTVKGRESP